MSLYAALLALTGLSQREAAELHGVRPDTVKSWSAGRRDAPDAVLVELAALHLRQRRAADEVLVEIERGAGLQAAKMELGVAADDAEARAPPLGWPCVGAHRMALAMIAAQATAWGIAVSIVPRKRDDARRYSPLDTVHR